MGEEKEISEIETFLNLPIKKQCFPHIHKVTTSQYLSQSQETVQGLQGTSEFDYLFNKVEKEI